MGRPALRVHAVLMGVQVIFAAMHVVGKVVLTEVSPMALAGLRVIGAVPILMVAALLIERHRPSRADLPRLAMLGLFGVAANQLLFIHGLERTTAVNASILMPSVPVIAAALAAFLGIERMTVRRSAGVALAVVGSMVMLDPTRFDLEPSLVIGNGLVLSNCICYALFIVLQRPLLDRMPSLTLIAWSFLFGGAMVLPLAFPSVAALSPSELSNGTLLGIAFIVLIPTTLGYALVTWAIRRTSPATVTTYVTLQPLWAGVMSAVFLGEKIGVRQAAGFVLIAGGLFLVVRSVPATVERNRTQPVDP